MGQGGTGNRERKSGALIFGVAVCYIHFRDTPFYFMPAGTQAIVERKAMINEGHDAMYIAL